MPKEAYFALISTAIYLVWAIPYWRDTIKWRTIPHPFPQMVGVILVGFNGFVLYINHEYWSLVPLIPLLFSIVYFGIGYGILNLKKIHINWLDYLSLISSFIIIIYWYLSRNTINTVILTCILDFTSLLPIFKKSWIAPWTETSIAWFTSMLNVLFIYLIQDHPTAETSLYWIFYIIMNNMIVFTILSRRYYFKWWKSIFQ